MLRPDMITVRTPRWITTGAWILLPLLGAVLGLLLARAPGWLTALPAWVFSLPFLPDQGNLTALAEVMGPPALIVLAVIGLLAGAFLALLVSADAFVMTVDPDELVIRRGDDEITRVPTREVRSALVEEGELVLQKRDGAEPFRGKTDLDVTAVQEALTGQGVIWEQADPYEREFTRWVDGIPGLDEHANAVLRERRQALEKEDEGDALALRQEAASRGVVVRDRAGVQQWRYAASDRGTEA